MPADFNDAILQALKNLAEGQRDMREEMNAHFGKLNGRVRVAEQTLASHANHEPRLTILEAQTADTAKQVSKVKTAIGTLTTGGTAMWALFTNWDKIVGFFKHP